MSCARCHKKRRKCDRGQGKIPCTRCAALGLECVAREKKSRKRYNDGNKRATPNKKTNKTKPVQEKRGSTPDALPDTKGNRFTSHAMDSYGFSNAFQHLAADHWGLQAVVKILMSVTVSRASWQICAAVSWLIGKTGLTDSINFFHSSGSAIEREYRVGDFGYVPDFVLRAHDEKVGATCVPPWSVWSKDNLGDRVLVVSSCTHTDEGVVSTSPRYHEMFVTEGRVQRFKDRVSLPMKDSVSFMYHEDDSMRCYHAVINIMKAYKTQHSGPITRCVSGVTMHHPQNGPIEGNIWVTLYLGQEGLDGLAIHEFVHGEAPSEPTSWELNVEDRSAAEALIQLTK